MANATSTQLQELYVAYFGRAADPTGLDYWTERGISTASFAADMYAQAEFKDAYGSLSTESQVNQIYKNLFDRDADVTGLNYWTLQINLGTLKLAEIANHLIWAAQNNSGSSDDKTALSNRTAAAVAYTAKVKESTAAILAFQPSSTSPYEAGANIEEAKSYLSGIDKDTAHTVAGVASSVATITTNGVLTSTANETKSYTLTTTADTFTGGASATTFAGVAGTIDGDTLKGGAGNDTLSLTVTVADDDEAGFTSSEIETISIRSTGGTANNAAFVDLSFANVTDLTTLELRRLADDVEIDDLQSLTTTLKISKVASAADIDINYDANTIAGSDDTVNITIDNSTGGGDLVINDVETIAITAVGADNDLNIDGDSISSVTIAGTGELNADFDASVTSVNAASNSGGVTMVASAAANVTYTGGTGADSFSMGTTLTADDTLNGGDGVDSVAVTGAGGALIPSSAAITNVETITATINGADTLDANIIDVDNITILATAATDDITVTDLTDEVITLTQLAAGVSMDNVNLSLASNTGTADSLTVNVENAHTTTVFNVDDIDSTGGGIESLTLNLTQGVDLASADDIQIDDISIGATTLTITGNADADIGSGVALGTATTISAGTYTGDLTLVLGAADQTVTTGSGDDTFTVGSNLTSSDTITAGTGSDSLTATLTAVTAAPTLSGVETLTLDFENAGNVFSGANTTGATQIDLQGDVANTITNLPASVTNIQLNEGTDNETVTITYATGSSDGFTMNLQSDGTGTSNSYNTITVTGNTGNMTVTNDDAYTLDGGFVNATTTGTVTFQTGANIIDGGSIGLDMVNATALAITTAGGNLDFSAAQTSLFTDATSFNLQALNGDILMDHGSSVLQSDANVTVTMNAAGSGNLIDVTTLNVDHVTTLDLSASSAGDVVLTDVNFLGIDSSTSGNDVTTAFTLTATGTGSSAIISDVTPASATTLDSLTMTSSSSGVVSFTAASDNLTITSIDASGAAANGVVLNISDLAAATTVTMGAGNSTITTSDGADVFTMGGGDATINVTAGGEYTFSTGTETVEAQSSASTDITGFDVSNDVIQLSLTELESAAFTSTSDLVDYNGISISALSGVVIANITGGTAFTSDASTLLRLTGTHASVAAVELAIEGDMTDLSIIASDSIVVLWSDGANAHVNLFEVDTVNTGSPASGVVDAVTHNGEVVELVGVDVTDLSASNFNIVA